MTQPISVFIIDDSAFMRKMVSEIISEDQAFCVIGQARNGEDALEKLSRLKPDVITLDVEMPVMDGLTCLEEIMRRRPTPVVMLSSLTHSGADITVRCLERGAIDFVGKPSGSISLDIRKIGEELKTKIKTAAGVRTSALSRAAFTTAVPAGASTPPPRFGNHSGAESSVLVIGASTGGPRALQAVIPALPSSLNIPIVIVQHMPAGFTTSLANRLNAEAPFPVREACEGDLLTPGVALLAPGGHHLQFSAGGVVQLTDEPPIHGVRPAVDVTLASLARLFGARTVAVLLTGMGKDGARGLKMVRNLGGWTLAEDESTCVVYGMPKSAIEINAAELVVPLPQIATEIIRHFTDSRKTNR